MKLIQLKYPLLFTLACGLFLSSCKRDDENIFNMFGDVTVTYLDRSPYSVTDKEIKIANDGDSLYIDFTIKSAKEDMAVICFLSPGSASPFLRIRTTDAEKREFSYTYKTKVSGSNPISKVGMTSVRVYALNKEGVYIGDGYKTVTVDVQPNFRLFPAREIYVGDTTNMDVKSYFSISQARTLSYNEGAANSANIDLGAYSTLVRQSNGTYERQYFVYSLSALTLPFTIHNISSWTKRATKFSTPQTGQTSNFNNLNTGEKIITAAKARNPNSLVVTTKLVAGSSFYFLTPEGQYGCILVNAVVNQPGGGRFFMLIDMKIADLPKS